MKSLIAAIILFFTVISAPDAAFASKPYAQFQAYSDLYYDSKVSAQEMLTQCNKAIEKEAKGNPDFLSYAYTVKATVLFDMKNFIGAREQVTKAIAAKATSNSPYLVLAAIEHAEGKTDNEIKALTKALEYTKEKALKKQLQQSINNLQKQ